MGTILGSMCGTISLLALSCSANEVALTVEEHLSDTSGSFSYTGAGCQMIGGDGTQTSFGSGGPDYRVRIENRGETTTLFVEAGATRVDRAYSRGDLLSGHKDMVDTALEDGRTLRLVVFGGAECGVVREPVEPAEN